MHLPLPSYALTTSSQSNLTERPHRRHTPTVHSYLPGCTNVHPNLIYASLDTSEATFQTASRLVQLFLDSSRQCPYTLQRAALFPPSKLPHRIGESGSPSNTWFPGPTRDHIPNDISISSAVFAGLTSVTDRQTDHTTPVCNNRLHLRP